MKKFLSLVLALVMTMSLVTVGAGAADFTDDSSITYEEAVDVMTALGVVGGYSDGSFGPKGTLTRGAAAKIICNLILGTTTADALVADSAPYSDVPVDNVFAGYIAYLAKANVIGGYADGTFRPAATLTGYAFMKMLLGVIGLDASIEGYTGANWSIAVAKRALSEDVDLTDGLVGEFNGTKAVTREEACLYAFNAIKAVKFTYDNKSTLVVGDITVSSTSEAKQNGGVYYKTVFSKLTYTAKDGQADLTDAFGRPAHKWSYDGDKIGTYTDTADYVFVLDDNYDPADYTDKKDVVDELRDLTGNDDLTYTGSTKLYLNGDPADLADDIAKKGVIVELFCDKNDIKTAVAIKTTLAKIDAVEDDLSKTETKVGAAYSIDLVSMYTDSTIGTYYDAYKNNDDDVLAGFDAKTYTEDTVIAVVMNLAERILDSYVVETVKGEVESYKEDDYVYVDDTKYSFAGSFEGVNTSFDFDAEYVLYMDANGYVLGIDGVTTADLSDVYYVTGIYKTTSNKGTVKFFAETVSLTGVAADLELEATEVDEDDFIDEDTDDELDFIPVGYLFKLTDKKVTDEDGKTVCKAGNDKYNVEFWDGDDDFEILLEGKVDDDVKATASKLTIDDEKAYIDASTQFVSIEKSGDDLSVKSAVGGMKIAEDDEATVVVITEKDKKDAKFVLVIADDLSGAVDTDDVVYLAKASKQENSKGYVATLYFMADNSDKSVTIDSNDNTVGFWTYSIDDDGVYDLKDNAEEIDDEVDKDTVGYATNMTFTESNIHGSDLSVGGYIDDVSFAGAKVIDVRSSSDMKADIYDKEITSVSGLKAAAKKGNVTVDLYVNDGAITFICVTAAQNASVDGE